MLAVAVMQLEKTVLATRSPTGLVYATDIGAFGLVQVNPAGEFQMIWLVGMAICSTTTTCIHAVDRVYVCMYVVRDGGMKSVCE